MTAGSLIEVVLGSVFVLIGVGSGVSSLREPTPAGSPGDRFMVALHDAAKAGFWLALGGFFIGYPLVDDLTFRWFALTPLAMAGIRLVASYFLSRS
ncbi:MAG TPA: hypothetical protein VHL78_11250 [Actinomycetota bacterium]|nr:hypothetical protein [Actinomycetota bacterium]